MDDELDAETLAEIVEVVGTSEGDQLDAELTDLANVLGNFRVRLVGRGFDVESA